MRTGFPALCAGRRCRQPPVLRRWCPRL